MVCPMFCSVFLIFSRPASNHDLMRHISPDINLSGTWTVQPSLKPILPINVSSVGRETGIGKPDDVSDRQARHLTIRSRSSVLPTHVRHMSLSALDPRLVHI